jgi:hypothetical protein
MVIHSPIFSGSITQDRNFAYADLSGSFTGSLTGSFKGTIDVQQATFDDLVVRNTLTLGNGYEDIQRITGSLQLSGSMIMSGSINLTQGAFLQDGTNVLDTALAFAIALG